MFPFLLILARRSFIPFEILASSSINRLSFNLNVKKYQLILKSFNHSFFRLPMGAKGSIEFIFFSLFFFFFTDELFLNWFFRIIYDTFSTLPWSIWFSKTQSIFWWRISSMFSIFWFSKVKFKWFLVFS